MAFRVLLADDEAFERKMLEVVLEEHFGDDVEIVQAADGDAACAVFDEKPADMAVLDIEMPGHNGIYVAQHIRKSGKLCEIVFLTAYDTFSYAKEALHVRALDYLLKPFNETEFLMLTEAVFAEIVQKRQHIGMQKDVLQNESSAQPMGKTFIESEGTANSTASPEKETAMQAMHESPDMDFIPNQNQDKKRSQSQAQKQNPSRKTQNQCQNQGRNQNWEADKDGMQDNVVAELEDEQRLAAMIRQYVSENFMNPISLQETARKMNYSEVYFCRLFKQFFGKNFTAWLTEYRLNRAKELLENPTVNIKDVGKAVGYPDQNYFTKVFKRNIGESPSGYRAKLKGTIH